MRTKNDMSSVHKNAEDLNGIAVGVADEDAIKINVINTILFYCHISVQIKHKN